MSCLFFKHTYGHASNITLCFHPRWLVCLFSRTTQKPVEDFCETWQVDGAWIEEQSIRVLDLWIQEFFYGLKGFKGVPSAILSLYVVQKQE